MSYAKECAKHERRAKAKEAREQHQAYKKRTEKWKEQNGGGTFTAFRHDLANSPEFRALSGSAVKIYCYFLGQYNRYNNGELTAPINHSLHLMGVSHPTAIKALNELIKSDFLEISDYSTNNSPTFYALTCFPTGKEKKPSDNWKKSK